MFPTEQDLIDDFSPQSASFLRHILKKRIISRSFLIREFDSYFGIPDLVLGTYRKEISSRKVRPTVNINWIAPMSALRPSVDLKIDDFCATFGLSRAAALNRLRQYEQAGFVQRNDLNTFKVIREYKEVTDVVVSIEAKLRDWKRALFQARRYSRFSDMSFVLLDGAQGRPALQNLSSFIKCNVGLVTCTKGQLTVHFVPVRSPDKIFEYSVRVSEAAYCYFTHFSGTDVRSGSTRADDRRCNCGQNT